MPRLIKYTTDTLNDVPDQALAVIEHASLFYIIDQRFKGVNKYIAFAVAGAAYEMAIDKLKSQSVK
jgi:hypothetical protein|tara:strand:+ start:857 stop:1054 length:198 start_codon:yes stop_codon:yes gene_type:complete